MSFIKELKRRNVIRVAVAYVVVAWLLLQVSDTLVPALRLPEWFHSGIALLLILAFPIALILAWAYELTPEGLKKDKDVDRSASTAHISGRKLDFTIITALVLALVYFAYDEFVIEPAQKRETATEIIATEAQQSIAVLPFVNMSGDPANEYFSDGMSEEILNLLAKIPGLKVIGRTSSFAFKGKNEDLRGIGRALGATTLLEGSVRKSGETLRITAQLIDASDGTHIWSETYDRAQIDPFAVQDDVAASIIDALQVHVGLVPSRGRPTNNSEAYSLYLKAGLAARNYDWPRVVSLTTRAVEIDPAFAEAYELQADSYWRMSGVLIAPDEAQERMRVSAEAALRHNPQLVLAKALERIGDPESYSRLTEIQAFEQAVAAEPDNPRILDSLFFNLFITGYLEEALQIARRLVEIDPLSPVANGRLPTALFSNGRSVDGFVALEIFDQLDEERTHWFIGDANLAHGRYETAIRSFEATLMQAGHTDTRWVRELVDAGRQPDTGLASFERRIPQIAASVPADFEINLQAELQGWYLYFGFVDKFYEFIMANDIRSNEWGSVDELLGTAMAYPTLGFVEHPNYVEVATLLGFVDVWEARGAPDSCQRSNGVWTCSSRH